MTWKKINVREEIYDRVAALAGRGSVSSMFEEIVLTYFKQAGEVEEALDESREDRREHHKANAEADGESDAERRSASSTSSRKPSLKQDTSIGETVANVVDPTGSSGMSSVGSSPAPQKGNAQTAGGGSATKARRRERKSTCEHRIPPGSFCRYCDE